MLRRWRIGLGLVQKQAADKLSVSVRTYQGWEAGKSQPNKFARAELERLMNLEKTSSP